MIRANLWQLAGRARLRVLCPLLDTFAFRLAVQQRCYAKAKPIATETLIPRSKQILSDPDSLKDYEQTQEKMNKAVDWFRRECATLESRVGGRVTPELLSPVVVKLPQGTQEKLNSLATVGVRDGTTLWITAFNEDNLKHIESALYESRIPSVVPQRVDVRTLKIPIPKPTVQLRDDTVKYAVRQAEKIRVQLRDLKAASIKEGSWPKHSKEVTAFTKLAEKWIAEVDKIVSDLKKAAGMPK